MNEYLVKNIYGLTYNHGRIYFVTNVILAILYFDCNDKTVKILTKFPEEVETVCAFEKIVKYGDKIYLFPCLADYVYCYDMKKREYHKLDIFHSIGSEIPKRKILQVFPCGEKIYCICKCPNMVICIDIETDNFQAYILSAKLPQIEKSETGFSVVVEKDRIIFPYGNDILIEFNINESIFNTIYLDKDEEDENLQDYIMDICVDRAGTLWICSFEGRLFKIINNKKIKVNLPENMIGSYNAGAFGMQRAIDRMFAVEDKICFTLQSECKLLQYNVTNGEFLWNNNNLSTWDYRGIKMAFINYTQIDNDTFGFYNRNDYAVYKWNLEDGFTEKINFKISSEELLKTRFVKEYWNKCDEDEVGLDIYICHVKNEKCSCKLGNNMNQGKKIYEELFCGSK